MPRDVCDLQKSKYSHDRKSIVIPILNVGRRKLRLRTEITFWLQDAAKLDLKELICKDEVNWTLLKDSKFPSPIHSLTTTEILPLEPPHFPLILYLCFV